MKLTDAGGQVIASYTYGVYGELLSGDTRFTRFLYNGRCGVATDDNGLYYMRQRYYNPEIKRFVNQDVLTGSISNSQSLNRYSYVQGNPVSYTDPFGLSPTNGLFTGTTFAHCLFAVLGCIPGPVGVAANLADALIYALVDHDYLMTGVSLLGALTLGAGGIAGMAVKGSKLARGARGVQFASGFLASGIMFAKNADNAAQVGRGLFDKYAVRKEPFSQKTLQELSALNLALAGCGMSAYGMAGNGQALAKVLKEAQVTSRLKNFCQTHALNNGGYVDADAFKANGAKAGGGGPKGGLLPGTLSNVDARKWYLEQETKIPDLINDSLPLEQQARQAFNLRNQYRMQARELMSDRQLAESLYASDPNLTWEQIIQKQIDKGLSGDDIYKAIIESSQRSRTSVNQLLGLE